MADGERHFNRYFGKRRRHDSSSGHLAEWSSDNARLRPRFGGLGSCRLRLYILFVIFIDRDKHRNGAEEAINLGTRIHDCPFKYLPAVSCSIGYEISDGVSRLNSKVNLRSKAVEQVVCVRPTASVIRPARASATPAYDLAGNMTTIPLPGTIDPSVTATYDAWNRLIKTTGSSNAGMLFSYDGLGRRISKASWNGSLIGPPRHYYLAGQQVIEERSGSDSHPEVQYVWSLRYVDELVLSDRDTGSGDWPIRWYTSDDANFNVTCAVGPTGSAVARYVYSPYGVRSMLPPNWTGMPPRVQLDIGHQGLIHDSETGLIYNRARTYHPLMGRFVQRDPMGYVDGMGLYQYLMSRPTNLVDAAGLDSLAGETTGMAAYIAELADALEAAKEACDLPKAIAIIHKIRDIAIAGGVMVGVAEEWSRDAITDAETSIQHNQQIPLDVEQAFQAHWKTIATAAALLGQCPDRCAVWRLLLSETTAQLAIDKQVVQDAKTALSQNPTQRFWLGMQAWGEQQVKDDQMYIREIKSKMKADGCK